MLHVRKQYQKSEICIIYLLYIVMHNMHELVAYPQTVNSDQLWNTLWSPNIPKFKQLYFLATNNPLHWHAKDYQSPILHY